MIIFDDKQHYYDVVTKKRTMTTCSYNFEIKSMLRYLKSDGVGVIGAHEIL